MGPGTRGKLIVVSAPSGAGKTTIAWEIMKCNPSFVFSVSATTRPKRMGEVDGRDYHFLTKAEFTRRVERGEFVEWEEVFGNYYGTLKQEVEAALQTGRQVVFDIDVKGGLSIKRQYPEALLIFIRPPSIDVLKERLLKRGTENGATLQERLDRVSMEMEKGKEFDHEVVNDVLSQAVDEVQRIVKTYLERK
jgi:guanylate kinase